MRFSSAFKGREEEFADLFTRTFAASEGPAEGALIGGLADSLMETTPSADLFVYSAQEAKALIGTIMFSRLIYSEDPRSVFVLGPVAVDPKHQGKGIGKALLRHGLAELRANGVAIALTYGDPGYYGKVGFRPISEEDAAAPFALQYPHGWLSQSLDGSEFRPILGSCRCVDAFDDPAFW